MKYKGCVVLMPAKYETKWLLSEKKLMSELCSDPLQQHWGICAALNLMDFLVGISVLSSYNLHQHYCLGDNSLDFCNFDSHWSMVNFGC